MKETKIPQRPKKRAKNVDRILQALEKTRRRVHLRNQTRGGFYVTLNRGYSLHDFSGTACEEAKALQAFTRTTTVFAARIQSNPFLSANRTYAVHSPTVLEGYSHEAAEQG
ncbi:hypothetical protein AAZX31_20G054600 [Glycine max]|nr:hypothetical protein GYH30_054973 [Glycine max]|eukprot:XP_014628104.1 uncharacterized protein LOC106797745 [Glycine max]